MIIVNWSYMPRSKIVLTVLTKQATSQIVVILQTRTDSIALSHVALGSCKPFSNRTPGLGNTERSWI